MKIVLADVETTGVGQNDRVCEIAWMHIDEDFNVIDRASSLINPGRHIPSGASAVNGITDMMVVHAPTLEEYFELETNPFIDPDTVFVAHNAPFDFRFLKRYIHKSAEQLCTLRVAREVFPDADSYKQSALAIRLGIEFQRGELHSAEGDLHILSQLLRKMCEETGVGIAGLLEIDKVCRLDPVIPFGKHRGTKVSALPSGYRSWLLTLPDLEDTIKAAILNLK